MWFSDRKTLFWIQMKRAYTDPVSSVSYQDYETLVKLAWEEDCPEEDITSVSLFTPDQKATASLNARESGILCGIGALEVLNVLSENQIHSELLKQDAESFQKGDTLLRIQGNLVQILRIERILLNFLQYLSGISTRTGEVVQKYGRKGLMIFDTRKTLPGYRKLAKYAVYCGGGNNHRLNLSEMAMIKDNHLAMYSSSREPVEKIKARFPGKIVEVEIDSLLQLEEAIGSGAEVILLDNFSLEDMKTAYSILKQKAPNVQIEFSGGITPEKLEVLSEFSGAGVSMGYLTHTTRFLDLGLDIEQH
ncbi:carboxylating nicotinate-nucleotide diphosphorylase [Leptospira borgpetersenii]|uniref:nicotinate-nucleotide diphosphorylase (carboxylating) n=1 Tax=Leptospira borgpetersenii serovar Ballum TaxID=280505 RepID=A0A0E3BLT3_LEPBO|nr:carboxylating nicotinate-nucleotide diphosphorylase [Leptospira borgpetersenii]EMO09856.1 nicotinate-nucleotide diphosphorylase (carboxylating) [Leptospira borgpetersenii str. Noumea 25]ALO24773.1 nicotinate-nucleotide diphosphorylase (carboxylating) [Leptospira borgpetersenii serovar Ballum]EKR02285.1 nicotinate-nucleotide diphosphorylase (carboxylating) [Leptospira borgpetersenii serovar Castellonis str. 200801910]KGE22890.1 nicotinate-nucleotide pyrophosphorylase [Leptospira borgpeterseni